jgi:hypothetical protein
MENNIGLSQLPLQETYFCLNALNFRVTDYDDIL